MACRSYPNPEVALDAKEQPIDSKGHPFPVLDVNYIRPELADFVLRVKEYCVENGLWMFIHSFNHGKHTPNSMHYRGLAVDWDFKKPNAQGLFDWMPIDEELKMVCSIAEVNQFDVWSYQESDHLHTSVLPPNYIPNSEIYSHTSQDSRTLNVTYG